MYGCESWTIKKAECRSIDAFNLWCWRRLLRIPRTARRSSQSILKEISPEYSLEGLILKLKLQYFGHLMRRTDSLEKTLMLGDGDNKGWDSWMASPTLWTWVWASSGSWWWTGKPDCGLWGQTRWLSHWTELSQLGVGGELLQSERLEKDERHFRGKWKWVSCSVVSDSATPWIVCSSTGSSLSMEFSRQEYWSR